MLENEKMSKHCLPYDKLLAGLHINRSFCNWTQEDEKAANGYNNLWCYEIQRLFIGKNVLFSVLKVFNNVLKVFYNVLKVF